MRWQVQASAQWLDKIICSIDSLLNGYGFSVDGYSTAVNAEHEPHIRGGDGNTVKTAAFHGCDLVS
jgi:hypothetical protein